MIANTEPVEAPKGEEYYSTKKLENALKEVKRND